MGSWLGREERRWWEEAWVASALAMPTTRGQCWPQTAWLCWKMLRGGQRAEIRTMLLTDFYLT